MKSIAKFNIGDEILVVKTNEKGIIKSVISELENENSLYLVTVNGLERMYTESYLELVKKADAVHESKNDIKDSLQDIYKEIIKELSLNNKKDELKNALKLSRYLAIRTDLEGNVVIKDNIKGSELYNNLMSQEDDYIFIAYLFSEVLKTIGMDAYMIGLKDEENMFYVSNLVLIGDKYYYFDNNLEREIYLDNCSGPDEFIWCSSALGSESYEQFFKPICIIALDKDIMSNLLPKNISKKDIDIEDVVVD